jgi:hypothetical protein
VLLALVAVGCAAPAPQTPGSAPLPRPAFDHARHAGAGLAGAPSGRLRCAECHALVDAATGRLSRPGASEHAPCDACHRDEFFRAPAAFCRMCHVSVDARGAAPSELTAWPPGGALRQRAATFNHRRHLDADAMEKRLGYHVGCRDCHLRASGEERAELAGHAGCAPCHGSARAVAPTMDACEACHPSEAVAVPQGRRFITGDLIFSHAKHERDRAGAPIACATCHGAVAQAATVEGIALPAMVDCAKCHEDPARTGERVRIGNCSVCHRQISAGVAPRDHLGGGRAPDSHTLAFRTDHAEAARSPQARCRFCHGGMSSTTRDNCAECHLTMKPRDHSLRWATTDHGPEAAMARERCVTCHEADYCARCHSQRPRSHVPFEAFVNGGHAVEARLNMRACMACHTFEDTCGRCHQGAAFPAGRPR